VLDFSEILPEMIATIVGVGIGGMGALYNSRRRNSVFKLHRAKILLENLEQELCANMAVIDDAKKAYQNNHYGKSFYLNSNAWDTATGGGDLALVLGVELADAIEKQYGIYFRLRYYVDLMTQLWFASTEIDGRQEIEDGLRAHVLSDLDLCILGYPAVLDAITEKTETILSDKRLKSDLDYDLLAS
jgi:hypothetical protein